MWCFVVSLHLPLMKVSRGIKLFDRHIQTYLVYLPSLKCFALLLPNSSWHKREKLKRKSIFYLFLIFEDTSFSRLFCRTSVSHLRGWFQCASDMGPAWHLAGRGPRCCQSASGSPARARLHWTSRHHLHTPPWENVTASDFRSTWSNGVTMETLECTQTPCCATLIYPLLDNYVLTKRDL